MNAAETGLSPRDQAMQEFNVDLNDRGAVYAKAGELNREAMQSRDYKNEKLNRLNDLLRQHDQVEPGSDMAEAA